MGLCWKLPPGFQHTCCHVHLGSPFRTGIPSPHISPQSCRFRGRYKDHYRSSQTRAKQTTAWWLHPNEKTLLYIANLWIIISHWYGKESPIETPNKAEGSTLGSSLMPCWYCLRYQSFPVKRNSQPSIPSSNHWCHIFLRLCLHWSQTCLSWQPTKPPIKYIYIYTYIYILYIYYILYIIYILYYIYYIIYIHILYIIYP